MKNIYIAVIMVLALVSTAAAATYTPASSEVELIGMEENQTFTANAGGSHTFTWTVDGIQVQQDTDVGSSSYDYPASPMGTDYVKVSIDGSEHTWIVRNVINMTMATASMQNLSSINYSLPNYDVFVTLWEDNESQSFTENMIDKLLIPIDDFWASNRGIGPWFWPVIIILTTIFVYVKVDTIEVTSIALILQAIAVQGTQSNLPDAVEYLMWAFIAMGVMGVLMSMFGGEE